MNESIKLQSVESPEQTAPVKIEYEITNSLGGNAEKHTITDFELVINSEDAFFFDGYIYTSEGNYGYQGMIREAKIFLADVQKLCELCRRKRELEAQLKDSDSQVDWARNHFQTTDESRPLIDAKDKSHGLFLEIGKLKPEIDYYRGRLEKYRL